STLVTCINVCIHVVCARACSHTHVCVSVHTKNTQVVGVSEIQTHTSFSIADSEKLLKNQSSSSDSAALNKSIRFLDVRLKEDKGSSSTGIFGLGVHGTLRLPLTFTC
ncbi:hypothetical protein OTU49_004853, partial [Cherax quadricarinatus]